MFDDRHLKRVISNFIFELETHTRETQRNTARGDERWKTNKFDFHCDLRCFAADDKTQQWEMLNPMSPIHFNFTVNILKRKTIFLHSCAGQMESGD